MKTRRIDPQILEARALVRKTLGKGFKLVISREFPGSPLFYVYDNDLINAGPYATLTDLMADVRSGFKRFGGMA